jgi:hypothetical protein
MGLCRNFWRISYRKLWGLVNEECEQQSSFFLDRSDPAHWIRKQVLATIGWTASKLGIVEQCCEFDRST